MSPPQRFHPRLNLAGRTGYPVNQRAHLLRPAKAIHKRIRFVEASREPAMKIRISQLAPSLRGSGQILNKSFIYNYLHYHPTPRRTRQRQPGCRDNRSWECTLAARCQCLGRRKFLFGYSGWQKDGESERKAAGGDCAHDHTAQGRVSWFVGRVRHSDQAKDSRTATSTQVHRFANG